ncbi:MAG TPA: GNAT family N-acetyltransferase [Candidatus Baltobacteraceae bacterium]
MRADHSVRRVERRDVEAWSTMRARLWPEAPSDDLFHEATAFITGAPETLLAAVFLAQDERAAPLGFLELSVRAFSDGCDSMPIPHVEGWYVEPVARDLGVGRALMRAAEEWAQERGFTELASDTEVHNEASQHAHQHCGFQEVDRLVKFRKAL